MAVFGFSSRSELWCRAPRQIFQGVPYWQPYWQSLFDKKKTEKRIQKKSLVSFRDTDDLKMAAPLQETGVNSHNFIKIAFFLWGDLCLPTRCFLGGAPNSRLGWSIGKPVP